MKLLIEKQEDNLTETTIDETDGELYIHGIFLQSNIKNRNHRFYPAEILETAVNQYVDSYVNTSRAIGELNHPDTPAINPERASHLITDLKREGNNWYGAAKILSTPMGNIVRGLLNDGVQLGVSSRGVGTLSKTKNGLIVEEGYELRTVDIVTDPSAPEAFVNGIYENAEWIFQNDEWVQVIEEAQKGVKSASVTDHLVAILKEDQRRSEGYRRRFQKGSDLSEVITKVLSGAK